MRLSRIYWKYITMWYNSDRLHSYLGYMSSNDYEQQVLEWGKVA
jgi:transposase InsO family protein